MCDLIVTEESDFDFTELLRPYYSPLPQLHSGRTVSVRSLWSPLTGLLGRLDPFFPSLQIRSETETEPDIGTSSVRERPERLECKTPQVSLFLPSTPLRLPLHRTGLSSSPFVLIVLEVELTSIFFVSYLLPRGPGPFHTLPTGPCYLMRTVGS